MPRKLLRSEPGPAPESHGAEVESAAVTDDELKQMFESLRKEGADAHAETRRQFAESVAEIRGQFAESVAENQGQLAESVAEIRKQFAESVAENQGQLAESVAEIRKQFAESVAENRRYFDVATERMEKRFDTLAETVAHLDETLTRETRDIREELRRGFKETQAMIEFSHA